MLKKKKILLGITGSIAAYKAAILVRLLVKENAEVKVIMTPAAKDFITPLTLSTLSKNPVLSEFQKDETGTWNNHVELGLWADIMLIAPASANTISKMAGGQCDNLLLATYLSAKCPVIVAPAMDLDMYNHPTTQSNIEKIRQFGDQVIEVEHGELASGLVGAGRMAEPENIFAYLGDYFSKNNLLKGKTVLVNAGPTHEPIDPVRFIGNNSSGKMGYAIAEQFAKRGAHVELVSGPSDLQVKSSNINLTKVVSAGEMDNACNKYFKKAKIGILAAAVADYTPKNKSSKKIKKEQDSLKVELVKTPDIAKKLGKLKKKDQFLVGFALETEQEAKNAKQKLKDKNFDMIVLNSLKDKGAGFGGDTNKITLFDKHNNIKKFKLKSKVEVANDIVEEILKRID